MRGGGDADRRARDLTWQLEQRIERLERERGDLRRILAGLGEGVLAVDATGVVLHANPVAVDLLGIDPNTSIGSHLFVAVPIQAVCDAIEDVMRGDVPDPVDEVQREIVVELDGSEHTVLVVVSPLRASNRRRDLAPEGAIAVVRDVTELRRLERSRQEFFANVSHELKTPITAIRGSLETIVQDDEMPSDVRARFLDGALRHAARLGALVTDLLALARLEQDPTRLQRDPVDLANLAREVLASAEQAAARTGVVLAPVAVAEGTDPAGCIGECDEEAVRQAISNLVDNAIAHSDEGGSVEIELASDGVLVDIVVHDTGTGIPPEALERVFERFYRVDAARSRARGGTGIGLSIVKHVAQAHGGTVTAESVEGRGSSFHLRLPVSRPARVGTPERA